MRSLVLFFVALSLFSQTTGQQPAIPATGSTKPNPQPITIGVPPAGAQPHRATFLMPATTRGVGGRVLISGAPPANPIAVTVSCAGLAAGREQRFVGIALTDAKGRYAISTDAIPPLTPGDTGRDRLKGCDLKVRVPGFVPDSRPLDVIARAGDRDVIELSRIDEAGKGNTISATSLDAPKNAGGAYRDGLAAFSSGRWKEAATAFQKAVRLYPGYAAAHFALGEVLASAGSPDEARAAYERAAEIDPAYVMPRIRLAWMAAGGKNWKVASRYSASVIELAPRQFTDMYLLRGTAELNLGNTSAAEQMVREGLTSKGDPEPQLLALIEAIAGRAGAAPR